VLSFIILGLLLLTAALWMLLERHETRRAAAGKSRHSGFRLLIAAIGILTVLFSGAIALLFFSELHTSGGKQIVDGPVVLLICGPPLAIGLLIWWLAMRRKPE